MSIVWNVVLSIIFGNIIGYAIVFATKKRMEYYKEEYAEWWTPNRYTILYIATTIIAFIFFFGTSILHFKSPTWSTLVLSSPPQQLTYSNEAI